MKKKFLIPFMLLCIITNLFAMYSVNASANIEGTCGASLNWYFDDNSATLYINGTGKMDDYSAAINSPWYDFRSNILVVIIGNGVSSIGERAFANCNNLSYVNISDAVDTIGHRAFYGCNNISSIIIPDKVKTIGDQAFSGCSSLEYINIGEFVESIGFWAFYNCNMLTNIILPNSLISIDGYAFEDCDNLVSISIPDDVKTIGNGAFKNCTSLKYIKIPKGITSIGKHTFYKCKNLTDADLSGNIISIGEYAFSYCESLKSIVLPRTVATIGDKVFLNCDNLEDIFYMGSKVEWEQIDIENQTLTDTNIIYDCKYSSEVVKICNSGITTAYINPKGIYNDSTVVMALYQQKQLSDIEFASYNGSKLQISSNAKHDTIKVMFLDSITTLEPLNEVETILMN